MDALLFNQMAVKYKILDNPIAQQVERYTYDIRLDNDCPYLKTGFKGPEILVSSNTIEEAISKAEKIIDHTLNHLAHYEPGLENALEGYVSILLEVEIKDKWYTISMQPLSTLRVKEVLDRYKSFEKSYEEMYDGSHSV